jgi:long-chain acyl-CoA synthetase
MSGRAQVSARIPDDPALQAEINRAVVSANKKVPPKSAIRTFRLLTGQFTVKDGLVTSVLEPRRAEIEKRFQTEVDALYDM